MMRKLLALPALLAALFAAQALSADDRVQEHPADGTRAGLLVVDYGVADAAMLVGDDPAQEVLYLQPGDQPLSVIAGKLQAMGGASELHVLSHGAPGGIFLAGQWIDAAALERESGLLGRIAARLAPDASILLYGCDVAATSAGRSFVDGLASLSGARVAASSTLTGSSELGGDWVLDYRTDPLTAAVALSAEGMAAYPHVLTHGRGGSITWQSADLDGDGQMNDVVITMKTAWRANWSPMPLNVSLNISPAVNGQTQLTVNNGARISNEALFVNGTSGSDADYALVTSVFHLRNVDPDTRYTVWNSTCCRISPSSGLQNNTDATQRIQSEIYLRDGNLAPKIDLPIVFQVPQRQADNSPLVNWVFPLNSSDPNADTLRYRLSTDAEMGGGGQVNPPGFSINPNTGLITWLGSGNLTPGHFYNASIIAEDLDENGNRKSMTQVDFLLELVDAPQTEFTTDNVPETRKVFVRKGETATIEIQGDAINTQSLGNLQGALTKQAGTDQYTFDPGPEGSGLDHGVYPITYEVRRNVGDRANNYLIINYVVPDPNAPWVDNIEGIRTVYTSPDAFMLVGDPDAPAEVTYGANPTLNGGTLKVNVSFVDGEFEVLGVQSTADIARNGNEIWYQGELIGLVHPMLDGLGRPLQIDFVSEFATGEAVEALIRALMYRDTFTLRAVGDRGLSLFLRDQDGRSNSYDFFVYVDPHPDAPEDSGPPVMASNRLTVLEGERAALSNANINFVDPDGGEVTLTVNSVSRGQFEFVSNPGTAITSFTQTQVTLGAVAFAHDGSREAPSYVLVAASAGGTADPSPGTVTFFNLNLHAPQISGTPGTVVAPGEAYSFVPSATDNDLDFGDSLTFSISNRPAWASFNSATGELSGTPGPGDTGSYPGIVISVRDQGNLAASLGAFTLQVRTVGGEGTVDEPFLVSTVAELNDVGYFPGSHFVISADLDLDDADWTPIGTDAAPFTGTLSGAGDDGVTLSGLNGRPLFGVVGPGAVISDIRIIDSHAVRVGDNGAGLLADVIAGLPGQAVTVSNVHVIGGSIVGGDSVGGLAGQVTHAQLDEVSSSAVVSGVNAVGGLIGSFANGTLGNAFASGEVAGSGAAIGGLVGYAGTGAIIEVVYATGPASGASKVGGLIGEADGIDRLRQAYATGSAAAVDTDAGSLVGAMTGGQLQQTYGIGTVEALAGSAGGLVGMATGVAESASFWDTDTTGQPASPVGTGLASEALRKQADNQAEDSYVSWSFQAPSPWRISAGINAGYPYFSGSPLVTLAADIEGLGELGGTGQYPIGSRALLVAEPGLNHKVGSLVADSCPGTAVDAGSFLAGPLFADCSVAVTFAVTGYDISVTAEPANGGTVSGGGFVLIGEQAVVQAERALGHVFVDWSEDGVTQSTAAEYSFLVDRARTLVATFEYVPLEIDDGQGGSLDEVINTVPGAETVFAVSGTGDFAIAAVVIRAGESSPVSGAALEAILADLGNGSYRFQAGQSGRYELTVADSNTGLTRTLVFVVWPQISGTPGTVATPGEAYAFTPSATGDAPETGGTLSFSISNQPGWASFDSATGQLAGTPAAADLGAYPDIVITVSDESGLDDSLPAFTLQVRTVSGEGTADEPFVISSPEQLPDVAYFPDSTFIISDDLQLDGGDWTPIGTAEVPFTGTLGGAGEGAVTISGLAGQPLFGHVGPGAVIRDIQVVDSHATRVGSNGAGLVADVIAGQPDDPVTLSNVHVAGGSIMGGDHVGGIAGQVSHALLDNVSSSANVSGGSAVGGLFGALVSVTLTDAFASGEVAGSGQDVGGLIGHAGSGAVIERVYATGPVYGEHNVGGLIGQADAIDRLRHAYATGSVTAIDTTAGGLLGTMTGGQLQQTYAIGAVEALVAGAGGLAGVASGVDDNANFWDTDTTGQAVSPVGTGLGSAALRKQAGNQAEDSYTTWSFVEPSPWRIGAGINAGYPYFSGALLVTLGGDIEGVGLLAGIGQYPPGSRVLVVAEPGLNHEVGGLAAGSCPGTALAADRFLAGPLSGDCVLAVTFDLTGFDISVTAEPGVGGTVSGGGFVIIGDEAVLEATPALGYVFVDWTEGGVTQSTVTEYRFAVDRARELVANFQYVPLEIGDGSGDLDGEVGTRPGVAHEFTVSGTGEFGIDAVVTRGGDSSEVDGDGLGDFLVELGNGGYRFEAPRSGRYEITFTDLNTGLTRTLNFAAWPQISFASAYQVGAPGHETVVRAVLDDLPVDQVSVDWQTADHALAAGLASQGTLLIEGHAWTGAMAFTPQSGSGSIRLDMLEQSLVGAVFGSHASHSVVLQPQMPMRADLVLEQDGQPRSIVAVGADGLTARLVDLPQGSYQYRWDQSSPGLGVLAASGAEVSFGAPMTAGAYLLRVTATDSANPQRSVSAEASLLVVSETELLAMCPDGDCTDSNGNGIPDALDQCSLAEQGGSANRLQVAPAGAGLAPVCLETTPGYRLRLGRVSLPAGRLGAGVGTDDIQQFGRGDGSAAMNARDNGYQQLGQHVDFELTGLDAPGQAAMVTIPLNMPIPEGAVWRKYRDVTGWFTFSTDGEDELHSASTNLAGDCPAPGSAGWVAGLVAGNDCVRLTLVDGGPNDLDGEANGVIRDPGVLALGEGGDTGLKVTSGGGGAMDWWSLVLAALLAGRGLLGRLRGRLRGPLSAPFLVRLRYLLPGRPGGWLPGHLPAQRQARVQRAPRALDRRPVPARDRGRQPARALPLLAAFLPLLTLPAAADQPQWYLGGQLGQARGEITAEDVSAGLAGIGVSGDVTVTNRTRTSSRLFAGLRLNDWVALEIGHTDLGKARTQLDLNAVVELAEISDFLPASTRAVDLSLYGFYPVTERLELYARGGVMRARTRYSVDDSAEQVTRLDTRGVYGAGVQLRLPGNLLLRAGYDRYPLPGEDIDHLAAGLLYSF